MIWLSTSTARLLAPDGRTGLLWSVDVYEEDGSEAVTGTPAALRLASFKGPDFGETAAGFIRLRRSTFCDLVWDDPAGALDALRSSTLDELAYRVVVATTVGGVAHEWRLRPQRLERTFDPAPRLRAARPLAVRAYDRLGALDALANPVRAERPLHRAIVDLLDRAQPMPAFVAVEPWPTGYARPETAVDPLTSLPDVSLPDAGSPLLTPGNAYVPPAKAGELLDRMLRDLDAVCYYDPVVDAGLRGPGWRVVPRRRLGLETDGRVVETAPPIPLAFQALATLPARTLAVTRWVDRGPDAGSYVEAVGTVTAPADGETLNYDAELEDVSFLGTWRYWTQTGSPADYGGVGATLATGESLVQWVASVRADDAVRVRARHRWTDADSGVAPRVRVRLDAGATDYWLDENGDWQTSAADVGDGAAVVFTSEHEADVFSAAGIPADGQLHFEVHGPAAGADPAHVLFAAVGLVDAAHAAVTTFAVPGPGLEDVTIGAPPPLVRGDTDREALSWSERDGTAHPRLVLLALARYAEARAADALALRAGLPTLLTPGHRVEVDAAQGSEAAGRTFYPVGAAYDGAAGVSDAVLVEALDAEAA